MGYDLYAVKPNSEKFGYFRSNIWCWIPLWNYVAILSKDILTDDDIEEGNYNNDHIINNELSVIIGKSRSHIANILRLLLLPEPVQTLLLERKITMGQARPLIGHKQCEMLAKTIVMRGLSARQAEVLAKHDATSTQKMQKKHTKSSDIRALERKAADKLGLTFNIDWDEAKERGKVVIDCRSLDQITDLLDKLGIN